MQAKTKIAGFKAKKIDLTGLSKEQKQFAVQEANRTGRPIEEIIQEIKEG